MLSATANVRTVSSVKVDDAVRKGKSSVITGWFSYGEPAISPTIAPSKAPLLPNKIRNNQDL